ncbi:MAG: beta-propeller domain-containing protein [Oscillospiraceae bacterium]|nr:beta-propeller domain-containing protein [Oscillospiraceae bacterium]
MHNDFEDKSISDEKRYIEQMLKVMDDYLIIPNSIRPEYINLKLKKRIQFVRYIAAAALVIIISMVSFVFILKGKSPQPGNQQAVASNASLGKSNTTDIGNSEYITKTTIDNYDELKTIYSKLIDNTSDALCIYDDTSAITDIDDNSVDTGDIYKTDGDHIFALSPGYERSDENTSLADTSKARVNIVSTLKTGEMKQVSTIYLDGQPVEMYLSGKKLIVITKPEQYYINLQNNEILTTEEFNTLFEDFHKENNGVCSDEMDKQFYDGYQYETSTQALIYDVSDVYNPKLMRTFTQDGYYSSSKLMGDNFYLITNKYDYTKHYDNLDDINPVNILPFTNDSAYDKVDKPIDLSNIIVFTNPNSYQYSVISGLNINNNEKATTLACLGGVCTTYTSSNSVYFLSIDYNNFANKDYNTNIIKYSLDNGVPKLTAIGKVSGTILNKTSFDVFDDHFRVATTNNGSKNNIYVLDSDLKIVGRAENILSGEQINSVSFIKDTCYLITNRDTDPIVSIDLSNPSDPNIVGGIKIPGFTSYLCPYSDTKLIGIGKNVSIKNIQGKVLTLTEGIELSFFDISDPNKPVLLKSIPIGGRGTSSEVLYDSKSCLFLKDQNILAFPVTLYENQNNNTDPLSPGVFSYMGYYIYTIDDAGNFVFKYRITHYDKLPDFTNSEDNNLFDNIGYEISRGTIVDGVLYTISEKMIMANSLTDFKELGKVILTD